MGGAPRRPKFVRSGGWGAMGSNGFSFLFAGGSCVRSFRWSRRPPNGFKGRDLNVTRAIRARFPANTAGKTRGSGGKHGGIAPSAAGRSPPAATSRGPPVRCMRRGGETGILPPLLLVTMPPRLAHAPAPDIRVRKAARGDLDALVELEERVFATDRLSRRSLRRFLASPSAELVVAQLA